MSDGFGQHYSSMYSGSMVGSGACVFAVMGYIVANTRHKTSCVELNATILATIIGEPKEAIESAIEKLCAPDPKSRTKAEDGRRLVKRGEFEYFVVNFKHYRGLIQRNKKSEYMAEYMAKKREEERLTKANSELTPSNASALCSLPSVASEGMQGEGCEIPTLEMAKEYAKHPACGFPPELVAEWFDKASDRGWGKDWRARMRGAVATYRGIQSERRMKGGTSKAATEPMTVWKLTEIIEAKTAALKPLATSAPSVHASKAQWQTFLATDKGQQWQRLKDEIKALNIQKGQLPT